MKLKADSQFCFFAIWGINSILTISLHQAPCQKTLKDLGNLRVQMELVVIFVFTLSAGSGLEAPQEGVREDICIAPNQDF